MGHAGAHASWAMRGRPPPPPLSSLPQLRLRPPATGYRLVPRDQLPTYAEAAGPAAGLWAFEALRIARGRCGSRLVSRMRHNMLRLHVDQARWLAKGVGM